MRARFSCGVLVVIILASSPVSAQSPCAECITAAQAELKDCLDNAISVDDKNACEENREKAMRACEDRDCTAETDSKELKSEIVEEQR